MTIGNRFVCPGAHTVIESRPDREGGLVRGAKSSLSLRNSIMDNFLIRAIVIKMPQAQAAHVVFYKIDISHPWINIFDSHGIVCHGVAIEAAI